MAVGIPISRRLGIKTGKERTERLARPPGIVIVSVLCSLARHGQALEQVRQSDDGCVVHAKLPSDIWSIEGNHTSAWRELTAEHCSQRPP